MVSTMVKRREHPDADEILLNNPSTSTFSIQDLKSGPRTYIAPSQDIYIKYGTWKLTLGAGFDFQIRVLQRPLSEEDDGVTRNLLSSERPSHSSLASKIHQRKQPTSPARG